MKREEKNIIPPNRFPQCFFGGFSHGITRENSSRWKITRKSTIPQGSVISTTSVTDVVASGSSSHLALAMGRAIWCSSKSWGCLSRPMARRGLSCRGSWVGITSELVKTTIQWTPKCHGVWTYIRCIMVYLFFFGARICAYVEVLPGKSKENMPKKHPGFSGQCAEHRRNPSFNGLLDILKQISDC